MTPAGCDCGSTATVQAPGAVAGVGEGDEQRSARGAACHVQVAERERAPGSVKTSGVVGGGDVRRARRPRGAPAPRCVRAVSAHAGPAVDTSADLTWRASSPGGAAAGARRRRRRAAPTCSSRRRPRTGPAVTRGSVDDRICPPGAETSGFSRWPKAVGPADEKLVTTSAAPGRRASSGVRPIRTACAAAARGQVARAAGRRRGRRSSRPEAAARSGSRSPRRAGCRSTTMPDRARGLRPGGLRDERARRRGETSAIAPVSEPRARACSRPRVRVGSRARRAAVDRPAVRADEAPTSTSVWSLAAPRPPVRARRALRGTGCRAASAGAAGRDDVERGREDVRVRDGRHGDRVGRSPR